MIIKRMSASLVWITPEAESLMGKIARVSSPENEDNPKISGLLKYMIRHGHWSPFEMASMCIEIKTTRDVSAQIIRHRSFSFQEFSQRYARVEEPLVIPELRRQDLKNRQSSIDDISDADKKTLTAEIESLYAHSNRVYTTLLESGVAKECARRILPMAAPTRIYMTGTIRSWIHYCNLRGIEENGAQLEHRLIAQEIMGIFKDKLPVIADAVGW